MSDRNSHPVCFSLCFGVCSPFSNRHIDFILCHVEPYSIALLSVFARACAGLQKKLNGGKLFDNFRRRGKLNDAEVSDSNTCASRSPTDHSHMND